jgi:hypothetical protein
LDFTGTANQVHVDSFLLIYFISTGWHQEKLMVLNVCLMFKIKHNSKQAFKAAPSTKADFKHIS